MLNKFKQLFLARRTIQETFHSGFCDICESNVTFYKTGEWLRDQYICASCNSIPRHRAFVRTIKAVLPDFREKEMHESSPGGISSEFLKARVSGYTSSQFFPGIESGGVLNGVQCQDLGKLSFESNSLDVFLTQDVFEHLLHPEKALQEIYRVLKPGGYHIFTFPWYYWMPTVCRVKEDEKKELQFLQPKVYHGNPVSKEGSIVTYDWGYDVVPYINSFGFDTEIKMYDFKECGLQARFLEVFVSKAIKRF